ncbi:hypothetical protein F2S72_08805 [Pseudomonas syringae pv. actinidiae]|nr:hypothetical protein [Pseudomonas syringae pv. actinidiae]
MNKQLCEFLNDLSSTAGAMVNGNQLSHRAQQLLVDMTAEAAMPVAHRFKYPDGQVGEWSNGAPTVWAQQDVAQGKLSDIECAYGASPSPSVRSGVPSGVIANELDASFREELQSLRGVIPHARSLGAVQTNISIELLARLLDLLDGPAMATTEAPA